MICPLHGPILKENLGYYIGLYDTWSKCELESKGIFIAYASIHGNTKQKRTVGLIENGSWGPMAAKKMREQLEKMKDITILDPVVTIKSAMKKENIETLKQLAAELL